MSTTTKSPEYRQTVDSIARFAELMHARLRADYPKAGDAQRELERLGVRVRFNCSASKGAGE